jgi:hypothetical protein
MTNEGKTERIGMNADLLSVADKQEENTYSGFHLPAVRGTSW